MTETELKIDPKIISHDLINGIALQFDYNHYYERLVKANGIPAGTLNNKLSMWNYYKTHPHKFPVKVSKPTEDLRAYQLELKKLAKTPPSLTNFDTTYYLSLYPDVAQLYQNSPVDAYNHWVGFGLFEMRKFRLLGKSTN